MTHTDEIRVLSRALDQTGALVAEVGAADLSSPTPCSDWSVADLQQHLAAAPGRFLQMLRGDEVDWAASPQFDDPEETLRTDGAALIAAWADQPAEAVGQADWQTAE